MGFLGRWLSHSVATAVSLVLAVLAMQAPAFTREYADALLQLAADARRDIDQRESAARRFYRITAESDDDFVQALQALEPANAEGLARSLERQRALQSSADRISKSPILLQPIAALRDALDDSHGDKQPIWQLLFSTYALQLDLSVAAAVYSLVGLIIGSLLAQLMLAPFHRLAARRRAWRYGRSR